MTTLSAHDRLKPRWRASTMKGGRARLTVYREAARAADSGRCTRAGISLGPLDGVIVSIKDPSTSPVR